MAYAITADDVKMMTVDTRLAVVQTVILAASANGPPDDAQRKRAEEQLLAIPWSAAGVDEKELAHLAALGSQQLAARTVSREEGSRFLNELATRIPVPLYEKVMYLAAMTMGKGNTTPSRLEVLKSLALVFRLTADQLVAIRDTIDHLPG